MKPYAVVQINTGALSRLVFETHPVDGRRRMYEGYYHNSGVKASYDANAASYYQAPCNSYFADTEEAAKSLAVELSQWHPGTTWQWMKIAGVASSAAQHLAMNTISIKNITDKGFLPE